MNFLYSWTASFLINFHNIKSYFNLNEPVNTPEQAIAIYDSIARFEPCSYYGNNDMVPLVKETPDLYLVLYTFKDENGNPVEHIMGGGFTMAIRKSDGKIIKCDNIR